MQSMSVRLIPAACVSLLGIAATIWWYQRTAPVLRKRSDANPIAYLDSDPRYVQRKPSTNLIWETVKRGETLFPHDTLRASRLGGARIRMSDSKSMIELEPDSVIVLEEKQGKISLDLVNGGLFVKNETGKVKEAPDLEIKIGGTKLAAGAKDLEMNIRRDKGGKASIAVVKGEVKAEAAGKTFDLEQGKSGSLDAKKGLETEKLLQVAEPLAGALIDLGSGESPVMFKWEAIGDDFVVHLETGSAPSTLKRVAGAEASGAAGKLAVKYHVGEHYWRLVAEKKDQPQTKMNSIISKFTAFAIQPPELASPNDKENVMLPASGKPALVRLSWVPNGAFQSYEVKVGRTTDLSDAVVLPANSDQDEIATELSQLGAYRWRVIGISKLNQRRVESPMRTLQVVKEEVKPPPPVPKLKAPESGVQIGLAEAQTGIGLRWEVAAAAQTFAVKVEKGEGAANGSFIVNEQNLSKPDLLIKLGSVGAYKWSVRSTNDVGVSEWSEPRLIRVIPAKLAVQNGTDPNADIAKPVAKMSWAKGPAGISKWRLGVSESSTMEGVNWQALTTNSADLTLDKFGTYFVKVEGLGQGDLVQAESDILSITINAPPKLAAPQLIIPEGAVDLVASAEGDIVIPWQPVERSHGYVLQLKNESGIAIIKTKTNSTQIAAKRLMPGRYILEIATVNILGEVGKSRSYNSILVPSVSAVKPPAKIGNFQIK